MGTRKVVRVTLAATTVALVIGAYAAWRAYIGARSQLSESRCDGHERFIQSQWMDTTLSRGKLAVRGCMVDDLLDRHELRGMTREQVIGLIGAPDSVRDLTDFDMVYWLGPQRGLIGTDSEYLVMKLDKSKHVTSVELITG